jgi:fructose-1,6-bisphosphatase-3
VDDEKIMDKILREFGLDCKNSHIVNGHVPVEQKKGQSPVHCDGKLLIIDGGFSKAYQGKTGIAGYTLVSNSHEIKLVALKPFTNLEDAIHKESEIISGELVVENFSRRLRVADTDIGKELGDSIIYLEKLLHAYREGIIVEKTS